jgi:hypothetical protein
MLFSLILFVDPDYISSFFKKKEISTSKNAEKGKTKKRTKTKESIISSVPVLEQDKSSRIGFSIVCCFFVVQSILPFRHYFIPGNADWTGDVQRFSWRMKIFTKKVEEFKFGVFDMDKKTIYPVNMDTYINSDQEQQMALDPSMILQFAHYLKENAAKNYKLSNIEIRVKLKLNMNDREPMYLVSDEKDLLSIKDGLFNNYEWVNPLN